jgi:hypothetical protein
VKLLLDHTIVGGASIGLTLRKDREFAGCAICGTLFQSRLAIEVSDEEWQADHLVMETAVAIETREWRAKHTRSHSEREHQALRASGRTFSPEAAHKLAPFGLVPLSDGLDDDEVAHAMRTAPRAPHDDVQTTLKGW